MTIPAELDTFLAFVDESYVPGPRLGRWETYELVDEPAAGETAD